VEVKDQTADLKDDLQSKQKEESPNSQLEVSNINETLEEEMQEELLEQNFFDYFISNPLPTDTILGIYPVCGAFSVFKNYKYKIKL
jgi:hypothetical protein